MILIQLLARQAGASAALLGPDQPVCDFASLRALAERTDHGLLAAGVPRRARVATALKNGPECAAAFLALGCRGAVAPLNPALTEAEFGYVLADLQPGILLVDTDEETSAVRAAKGHGIAIGRIERKQDGRAGEFDLRIPMRQAVSPGAFPSDDDEILLLHTSGTTSRPKLVPIRQAALCESARSVAQSLGLSAQDASLNVMPLFHVHGLVASLTGALSAGGSVWCSPGFSALHFWRWLEESGATWYSAVPSMHQAILSRQPDGGAARHGLRVIRSCSAPLLDATWIELERAFGVPVVQAYGMTEAAHQVSCSRVGDSETSRGTVGRSTGPEIVVVDENGDAVEQGREGEVALRGATMLREYLSPPGANESAFRRGLFLTGDLGVIDANGNLRLLGRRKEMINCGGEKISPYEIEEALSALHFVEQSAAFPVPHPLLGEEPGAVLVCAPGHVFDASAVRCELSRQLSSRKVPRRFWVVEKIPTGPTGKVQRSRMASLLEAAGAHQ